MFEEAFAFPRSPWSNEFQSPTDDVDADDANADDDAVDYHENHESEEENHKQIHLAEECPKGALRKLEQVANAAFDTYQSLYYEGAVSSVYVWDLEDDKKLDGKEEEKDDDKDSTLPSAFAAAILIHKRTEDEGNVRHGEWDSIHLIEVEAGDSIGDSADKISSGGSSNLFNYRLTSTILLHLDTKLAGIDEFALSGSLTRTLEQQMSLPSTNSSESTSIQAHVAQIGRMVEQMELQMRSGLQEIYFGKTHEIVNEMRLVGEEEEEGGGPEHEHNNIIIEEKGAKEPENKPESTPPPSMLDPPQPTYMRHQSALQREMALRLGAAAAGGFKLHRPSNATAALTTTTTTAEQESDNTVTKPERSVSLQ